MRKLLVAAFVALLMVGCGGDTKKPAGDSLESNQTSAATPPESNASSVETPPAKTAEVGGIDLDDNETRNRIAAEAIDGKKLQRRGKEGKIAYAPNQQTPYTGWIKTMRDNGQVMWLGQVKDGKKDGLQTVWYSNGQKMSELTWNDGKLIAAVTWKPNGEKCPVTNVVNGNGLRTWYYENGQKHREGNFKDGKPEGLSTSWHENGLKQMEVTFKGGKMNGLLTSWYPEGQKYSEQNYKDGKQDGPSIGWFGNGKKRVEVSYKDGHQQGIRRNWYENGKEKSEYTYNQGKLVTASAWKINGVRCMETDVVDGDGVGVFYGNDGVVKGQSTYKAGSEVSSTFITWDENGCKRSETSRRGNKKHGLHTFWNANGEKSAVYNYKNDKLDGPMIQWHKNGQKSFSCNYQEGKPDGLSNSWYANGKKRKTQTWDNGKLITTVVWKPNGEKCPVSKIDRDGNGVVVWYNLTGRENSRRTYKDGY